MSTAIVLVEPPLAQTQPAGRAPDLPAGVWLSGLGASLAIVIGLSIFFKVKLDKLQKALRTEEFKNRELKKRLDLALKTIRRMETNPDLINSREFNLDYLRMRMSEETFHFAIVNQVKMKVKMLVSVALRPTPQQAGAQQTNAGHARQIDHTFDVEYETDTALQKKKKRVLFRIQIRLTKLPTQATSRTIQEIIGCLERYLSTTDEEDGHWQPTLQGRIATIRWDQKAKPTPLLVLEQSAEGMNVTMRTRRELSPHKAKSPA